MFNIINLLLTLAVGTLAGYGAGKIMNDISNNLLIDCLLGIFGGFVGNIVFGLFGFKSTNLIGHIIITLVGSCLILYIKKVINGKKKWELWQLEQVKYVHF